MPLAQSVAIVGVGGEFPASPTLDRFWDNIVHNVNTASEPPAGRWLLAADEAYDARVGVPDRVYSRKACFLDPATDTAEIPGLGIDAGFLARLDPMFRLLLRVGQQTLADVRGKKPRPGQAGIIIGNLALPSEKSSALARSFLGQTFVERLSADGQLSLPEHQLEPLNHYVAGLPASLLARVLGFQRTCFTVDAACASSLYAIKLAVDELLSGRADAMLAGGLSRPDSLYTQMGFSQLRALSPSGTCSPFDRNGNGLVVGEGCGLVLLKRTQDAVRDGDRIYAVIRGIGLSNDLGGNLLAPAAEGQLRAMRDAYKQAGWTPDAVDLIECHATGTPVGDAVEFSSLSQLWQDSSWRPGQCVIGSVKANIGHLLTAAGSAALLKTLVAMKHEILPPTVNFDEPAAGIDLDSSPFRILKRSEHWERRAGQPRRAAVSAFGFGGINAHLLIEEWRPAAGKRNPVRIHPSSKKKQQPVAIVGMATHFGGLDSLDQFAQQLFKDATPRSPETITNWWGAESSRWLRQTLPDSVAAQGYPLTEVSAVAGEFRIPPLELAEMLPRQLAMLKVAAAALADADLTAADLLFAGVFIGCGLDLNATNFSFRWALEKYAPRWAQELGLELDEQQMAEWIAQLRTAAGPALSANRTMGALGSTVASRIAKEFRIGGPSFTLSSEETSGLSALQAGIHALQEGSITRAIVGAVDFAADLRAVLSRQLGGTLAEDTLVGEGAAALVLKRLADAKQDGDRIYAVISGIDSIIGGSPEPQGRDDDSWLGSLQGACAHAGIKPCQLDAVISGSSGPAAFLSREAAGLNKLLADRDDNRPWSLSAVADYIGDSGGAGGLAAVVQAALCLHRRLLSGTSTGVAVQAAASGNGWTPQAPQYWLHNRVRGPRRMLVSDLGLDHSALHAVLEEYQGPEQERVELSYGLTSPAAEALFVIEGDSPAQLLDGLAQLQDLARALTGKPLATMARSWFEAHPPQPQLPLCISLVSAAEQELNELISYAEQALRNNPEQSLGRQFGQGDGNGTLLPPALRERIFYSADPLTRQGKVAFVFPGSGNHFAGMGRELSLFRPDIYAAQEQSSLLLADQYQPWRFWNQELQPQLHEDHNALVISHVALCTALHDLLRNFNIHPQMISGYSLGESSGLFSSSAWRERDGMLKRLKTSALFTDELAGACQAARRIWNLPANEPVDWSLGIVNVAADKVRSLLQGRGKVYLLIVNSYRECVIGGQRSEVERLVRDLGCHFIPLQGVTTVHCEVTKAVAEAYRRLHLFEVTPPPGIDFYSCALGKKYPLTSANAADVILAQALDTIDYPRVIEQLYADGARLFLEVGPGNSCSRMINSILGERPHLSRALCASGVAETTQLLRLLAHCLAERVPVDFTQLYPVSKKTPPENIAAHGNRKILLRSGGNAFSPQLPDIKYAQKTVGNEPIVNKMDEEIIKPLNRPQTAPEAATDGGVAATMTRLLQSGAAAHEAYLNFAKSMEQALSSNIRQQLGLLQQFEASGQPLPEDLLPAAPLKAEAKQSSATVPKPPQAESAPVAFDRAMCLEFAIGSVGKMLGPDFAAVDQFPSRVRLPDEPLMLVDRILSVEGQPKSMTQGRVVTEHDVTPDRWYLDGLRIPTCVAVEAGQADLFLSGYLGIDFITKGEAVYRLLDAEVTFHRGLPQPGDTIRYDIKIHNFFRQDQTYLFRFSFEGTVNGQPLLSMAKGCAGFFSAAELAAGRGIVHTKLDLLPQPGKLPTDWQEPVPLAVESYNETQIDALYRGDLVACFGPQFANLPLQRPYTLPGGKLKLVDRVTRLDPRGGRYGIGQISAEMDIHPEDWFLTCHFVDDRVMPGTLMYECCLHTLRIYLLRMGWIGEEGETWCEPVPGVTSGLKCRGQVIESTKTVTYRVNIKELGYGPEPYAIVDALMYADGHPIVEIPDMSVRLSGLNRAKIEAIWSGNKPIQAADKRQILFDTERITAFAIGKPSFAFGEPYQVFDQERKIARLPGPPFQFLDRIVAIDGEPWKLVEGVSIVAEYDVPPDAWYFAAGRQSDMPFSVLLEIGLQPCGWLAAYLGSALTSPVDLSFRNLDGNAVMHRPVTAASGTLEIAVKITRIASSGGMIIQGYDFQVSDRQGPVYSGDTLFGFFSKESLAQQVGVRGAALYEPGEDELATARSLTYPEEAPFPASKLRMIDRIELLIHQGGPHGLGYVRGQKKVDPEEWFFKAHFYQDPVCPGSLGLESFLQLLKVFAAEHWQVDQDSRFETVACGMPHSWNYRGQVIPANRQVTVEAMIKAIDEEQRIITADGSLSVDGKVIYQMHDFSLRLRPVDGEST